MQRTATRYEGIDRPTPATSPLRPAEYRTGVNAADGKSMAAPLSSGSLLLPVGGRQKLVITPRFANSAETADLVAYLWQTATDGTRVCMGRTDKATRTAGAEDGRAEGDAAGDFVAPVVEFDTHGCDFIEVRAIAITGTLDLVAWLP